ncbi:MAG: glycosyltransferase family 4 protein [Tissierellaceae bacterium]|jgi:glycosyltransferase involved in cell wall biosynthesis
MRILWVVASPIGNTERILFNKNEVYGSGHWIDNTAQSLLNYCGPIELAIVTTSDIDNILRKKDSCVTYYCLNLGKARVGKEFSKEDVSAIQFILDDFKPDLIHIWGSETGLGLLVAEAAKDTPIVLCIQGLMAAISKYPNGGLKWKQLTNYNILDMLKYPFFNKLNKIYDKQAEIERKLIRKINHVISESEWSISFCKEINPTINCHWFPLQLDNIFIEKQWNIDKINRFSIFSISGRGAHKGIHIALKAMRIIIKNYPDAILYIPGRNPLKGGDIRSKLLQTPYTSYLKRLIKKYNLENNVIFTGMLNTTEMAEYLCRCNVFIMPSCIENQSASLREALSIGTPSVSSYVGCIDEAIIHKETGYTYRYEEYEVLAHYVSLIFDNDELASNFSYNSREFMRNKYWEKDGGALLYSIYEKIKGN